MSISRDEARALDRDDPLAPYRDEFVTPEPEVIYLDGNSLGKLPKQTVPVLEKAIQGEWAKDLVRGWHDWIGLSQRAGDTLAPLIGAQPGEVLVADQTSINLYKLAWAAVAEARAKDPKRVHVVADDSNFPSDRYVLSSVAEQSGGAMREAEVDSIDGPTVETLSPHVDHTVALVSLSMVAFKSGALADAQAITKLAHDNGAKILWDLSHAAGAIEVDLGGIGADLAVGCTYKYLNGGPGSPAFLYVRKELQEQLVQPIPGWFGHDNMFAFEGGYRPANDIRRFAIGTPPVLSLRGAESGIGLTASVGMAALRKKSVALSEFMIHCAESRLGGLGFELGTPRDPSKRGSHVSFRHPLGYGITQALIARNVIPDFRAPDNIRFGIAPLYNSFRDIYDAIDALGQIVEKSEHEAFANAPTNTSVT